MCRRCSVVVTLLGAVVLLFLPLSLTSLSVCRDGSDDNCTCAEEKKNTHCAVVVSVFWSCCCDVYCSAHWILKWKMLQEVTHNMCVASGYKRKGQANKLTGGRHSFFSLTHTDFSCTCETSELTTTPTTTTTPAPQQLQQCMVRNSLADNFGLPREVAGHGKMEVISHQTTTRQNNQQRTNARTTTPPPTTTTTTHNNNATPPEQTRFFGSPWFVWHPLVWFDMRLRTYYGNVCVTSITTLPQQKMFNVGR